MIALSNSPLILALQIVYGAFLLVLALLAIYAVLSFLWWFQECARFSFAALFGWLVPASAPPWAHIAFDVATFPLAVALFLLLIAIVGLPLFFLSLLVAFVALPCWLSYLFIWRYLVGTLMAEIHQRLFRENPLKLRAADALPF